jgi:hypothetical protein
MSELTDRELAALAEQVADRLERRGVLAGGVGLAAGGAAGALLGGGARADPDNTQTGTFGDGNEDWDVEDITANHMDASSVETGEVSNDNYVEPQVTASASSSYTADLSAANYHKLSLTGDVSIDFSNVDGSETNSVVLHLVQDGTGGRTPSFTPTVVWGGGSPPSWSTSANAEDVVTLVHDQDGSQWLGFVGGIGMA